jgi:hypothetical protein
MKPVQISNRPPIGAPSIPTCSASPTKDYLNEGQAVGAAWLTASQKEGEHGWNTFGTKGGVPAKCLGQIKTPWQDFGTMSLSFFLRLPPASFIADFELPQGWPATVLFHLANHFPGAGG